MKNTLYQSQRKRDFPEKEVGMKQPIAAGLILLFLGMLYGDADLDAIMKVNANSSSSNVPHAKWVFSSIATTIKLYMVAQKTANPNNTIYIRVGSFTATPYSLSSTASAGSSISISCAMNQKVFIYIKNKFGDSMPAWDTARDGFCRLKVLSFPGYEKTGISIPPGLWLGWDDTTNTVGTKTYDYNNFCAVLTGCQAKFVVRNCSDNTKWDTAVQNPRYIRMAGRVIERNIENKY
jgi:hypothetical protein